MSEVTQYGVLCGVQPRGRAGGAWRQPRPCDFWRLAAIHAPACIVRVYPLSSEYSTFKAVKARFWLCDAARLAAIRATACTPRSSLSCPTKSHFVASRFLPCDLSAQSVRTMCCQKHREVSEPSIPHDSQQLMHRPASHRPD